MTAEYIMGVDYGDKRVGVALAHQVARLPRPFTTLAHTDTLLTDLQQLVAHERVARVVVGLPRGMDGGYTAQTRAAEAFAEQLAETLAVPVELADETLTSVDAAAYGATKQNRDAVAAALILERYLAEHPGAEVPA